jgi:hypothetical protein
MDSRSCRTPGALGAAALLLCCARPATAQLVPWVVLGADGIPVARVALEPATAACPQLKLTEGGKEQTRQMEVRHSDAVDESFAPVRVCELTLTKNITAASIDLGGKAHALPLPKRSYNKIVFFGDTGCRLKKGVGWQNCLNHDLKPSDDEGGWPYKELVDEAAKLHPDLVIHVGDYIYRKSACKAPFHASGGKDEPGYLEAMCKDSPHGQNWAALKAELMVPSAALFQAAPWVVPRGNHENCGKLKDDEVHAGGGLGFFLMMDPGTLGHDKCRIPKGKDALDPLDEETGAYTIPLAENLDLWVVDSNAPEDTVKAVHPHQLERYKGIFAKLVERYKGPGRRAWFASHRPLYAQYPGGREETKNAMAEGKTVEMQSLNVTLQESVESWVTKENPLDVALSGHMHVFQVTEFPKESHRPIQFVVGDSGTQLDTYYPASFDHFTSMKVGQQQKPTQVEGKTIKKFGFMLLERSGDKWTATLYEKTGGKIKPGFKCELEGKRCKAL